MDEDANNTKKKIHRTMKMVFFQFIIRSICFLFRYQNFLKKFVIQIDSKYEFLLFAQMELIHGLGHGKNAINNACAHPRLSSTGKLNEEYTIFAMLRMV